MEITIVRQENRSFFEPLMPVEQWQFADLVLGAIEEGTACGVDPRWTGNCASMWTMKP